MAAEDGAVTEDSEQLLLRGLAAQLDLPVELLHTPGTNVLGRQDRADTGMAVCYWAGARTLVWVDPVLEERFAELASETEGVTPAQFSATAAEAGLGHFADARLRVLPPEAATAVQRPGVPAGYRHERLTNADVDRVRALTVQCSEEDVEEAALDELDEFDEQAINVLLPADAEPGAAPIAYASACSWDWDLDPTDGFGDIGVLVHPDHRKLGLGLWAVLHTCADLIDDGVRPLYRHLATNAASAALASHLGFEVATDLTVFVASGE